MGKGDKKSKRGKIFMGTFGVKRSHNPRKKLNGVKADKEPELVAEEKPAKKKAAAGAKKK